MGRGFLLFAGLLSAIPASRAQAQAPGQDSAASVLGRWLTRDADGVFLVEHCGAVLCGQIIGLRYKGAMPVDTHHKPQCGMVLLNGFTPTDEPGHWHGTILDPDHDHRYQATIWSPKPGVLKLHGYLLLPILGQTQNWTRYSGTIGPACKMPD